MQFGSDEISADGDLYKILSETNRLDKSYITSSDVADGGADSTLYDTTGLLSDDLGAVSVSVSGSETLAMLRQRQKERYTGHKYDSTESTVFDSNDNDNDDYNTTASASILSKHRDDDEDDDDDDGHELRGQRSRQPLQSQSLGALYPSAVSPGGGMEYSLDDFESPSEDPVGLTIPVVPVIPPPRTQNVSEKVEVPPLSQPSKTSLLHSLETKEELEQRKHLEDISKRWFASSASVPTPTPPLVPSSFASLETTGMSSLDNGLHTGTIATAVAIPSLLPSAIGTTEIVPPQLPAEYYSDYEEKDYNNERKHGSHKNIESRNTITTTSDESEVYSSENYNDNEDDDDNNRRSFNPLMQQEATDNIKNVVLPTTTTAAGGGATSQNVVRFSINDSNLSHTNYYNHQQLPERAVGTTSPPPPPPPPSSTTTNHSSHRALPLLDRAASTLLPPPPHTAPTVSSNYHHHQNDRGGSLRSSIIPPPPPPDTEEDQEENDGKEYPTAYLRNNNNNSNNNNNAAVAPHHHQHLNYDEGRYPSSFNKKTENIQNQHQYRQNNYNLDLEEEDERNTVKTITNNRDPNYSHDWRNNTNYDRSVTPPPEANWKLRGKEKRAAVLATSVVAPSREDLLAHLALLTAHRKGKVSGQGHGVTSPPPTTSSQPTRRRITSTVRGVSSDSVAATINMNPQWSAINRAQQETARLRNQFEDLNKEIQSMKQRTSSHSPPMAIKVNSHKSTRNQTTSHPQNNNITRTSQSKARVNNNHAANTRGSTTATTTSRSYQDLEGSSNMLLTMRTPSEIIEEGKRLIEKVSTQ